MVQSLQKSDVVMAQVKKRPILNFPNNFFSSYQGTRVTKYNQDVQQSIFCGFKHGENITQLDFLCFQDHDHTAKLQCECMTGATQYQ